MSTRREKWEAGGLSITTWTEGHIRCFVCYRPSVSIYCQTTQEVLQFAAWPASLPTGASLRSWLASLSLPLNHLSSKELAADQQRNLEQDRTLLKATGFDPGHHDD